MSIARWLSQEGLFIWASSNLSAIPFVVLLRHVEQVSFGLRACRDPMLSPGGFNLNAGEPGASLHHEHQLAL
jgi:hypothetical protein